MLHDSFRSELVEMLAGSRADAALKADVLGYADGRAVARVVVLRPAPRLKVVRLLAQLLHAEPTLAVSAVEVDGASGCSDFRGTVSAQTPDGARVWRFHWDCRWRAEEEGWLTDWGLPDQARAADELNWRCFSVWEPLPPSEAASSPVEQGA